MYKCVQICTNMYKYVQICTCKYLKNWLVNINNAGRNNIQKYQLPERNSRIR